MSSQAILDVYTVEYVVIYPIATLSVMYFTYGQDFKSSGSRQRIIERLTGRGIRSVVWDCHPPAMATHILQLKHQTALALGGRFVRNFDKYGGRPDDLYPGRIWWIMWRARVHNNPLSKYGSLASINRIILESGMIYPISIVVHLSTSVSVKTENIPVDLLPIIVLIAGIAPTLIVVRTSMGQSIVNEMQTTSETFTSVRISDRIGSHTIDEGRIVPSGNAVGQGQSTV
uniref:Uncharacterized protein n=1 Tax=Moniliophthora roreri TaxID=221103 RepID=A0A0W0G4W1_MONRR